MTRLYAWPAACLLVCLACGGVCFGDGRPKAQPVAAPPPGQEASYEWYVKRYKDPGIFTPIGPPADPAETAVSPRGQLMNANDRGQPIPGTPYVANALAFAVWTNGQVTPFERLTAASQSVVEGCLPIVVTRCSHDDFEIRQTAFAEPLRGAAYSSGLESTLAWAVFNVTNRAKEPRELALLAAEMGSEKAPRRNLSFEKGVVMEDGSARLSVQVPDGVAVEFKPVFPENAKPDPQNAVELLRRGGLYNVLVIRGKFDAGQTKRILVSRVFDFLGTEHWGAQPPKVAAAELLGRSPEKGLENVRSLWKSLAAGVSRLSTPDDVLNRIVRKGMLDGYFLTKRWNQRYIVFDSVVYRCQWDDASSKWFYALDLMGDHATASRLLDTVFARQGQRKPAGCRTREGCFSDVTNITSDGSRASWTSCNGWALWAIAQHTRLTGDRDWLAVHKGQILEGCDWIVRERQFSEQRPDNPCAGLIYGKFVCDMADTGGQTHGVSGVGYFTYTDAISYLGLHQMAQLLAEWGHPEGEKLLREAETYRQDIIAAVDRLTDKSRDPWYVPWVLHAPKYEDPYFQGVCGPINLAFGGVLSRDDPRIGHVIRWDIDHTRGGSLEGSATASMFYSQDLACVLLEQGRVEDFLRMFYVILAANVSHETLTTCEWQNNTQPHIHSISSLVRMFRTMLIQERDGGLSLLQGTPRRWLEEGKEILITDAPTWYGPLSLKCVSDATGEVVHVGLKIPPRVGDFPIRLRLRLPEGRHIGDVAINGRPHRDVEGEWILLRGLRGQVDIAAAIAK